MATVKKWSCRLLAVIPFIFTGINAGPYHIADPGNPQYHPNLLFQKIEDYSNPKFAQLRAQFKIDTVVAGEADEFRRILLLRNWIRRAMPMDSDQNGPVPNGSNAIDLLTEALSGKEFVCSQYFLVQEAVLNAYGYHTQLLGAGPGIRYVQDGHHGVNEVWSNKYCKWVLMDAMFDHHFEKDSTPLSPLEVRDEWLKNKGADIHRAVGPNRVYTPWDTTWSGLQYFACPSVYTWVTFLKYCTAFTGGYSGEPRYMYQDEYASTHIWYWNGNVHWAWNDPNMLIRVPQREKIEWTPGVMTAVATFSGSTAAITLGTSTPNLKEYQINSGTEWVATPASFSLDLTQDHQEWQLRTVNLAGVTGPLFRLVTDSDAPGIRVAVSRATQALRIFSPHITANEIEIPFTSGLQRDLSCTIFDATGRVVWRSSPLWDRTGAGVFLAKRPPAGVYFGVLRAETGSAVLRWAVP